MRELSEWEPLCDIRAGLVDNNAQPQPRRQ